MDDLRDVRQDFPILERSVHGKRLVYLDNAATTQKPRAVLEALDAYYRRSNANVHRSVHKLAEEATLAYEDARRSLARFINAARPEEVIFTSGTTEGINLVAYSWGRANVRAGDAIVLTDIEHHSNLVPWQLLAQEKGAELRYFEIGPDGSYDLDAFDRLLDQRVKLVSCTQLSNVLGVALPIAEITRRAHA
ncbi:MAG TPA: aminotransferase class V-fold PLP-dependent enzyme, partial [Bacillota bacterium]